MEILASRRRQLMSTKSFRGTRKKSDSPNASTISIKMGSQSFRSRQGSVCSPVVLRNKIQTSPSLMRDKTHHGVKEKQNINVPSQTNFICDDLRRISKSLDCLNNDIMMQHREILRDVESKIPSVNKGIISDIDRIRENLHSFEFIVQNRDVESGLSSTISDDEIGEFTVKSVENLVSRSPWSPSSLNSSPYSISNMFSPGAKSQDSGIFFDDHRPHSCEVSLISPFKDGIADNDWTTCSGGSYVDMFDVSEEPCFNTPFKEVDQCHGYHSDENIESYGYQTVVNTLGADVDESWTLDTVNIDNVPVDKYESTTHKENLPRQDESYSERNSDEEQQRVLDTNDVDLEGSSDNCSIGEYRSTTYQESFLPKDNTCFERDVDGTLYESEHAISDTRNKTNEFAFFPEAPLFDWRCKVLSARYSCQEQFDEELQLVIDANQNFRENMVRSHNAFRIYHGCQDLVEADDLTRDAQMWADIIAEKSFLQYSELPGRGENVAFLDTNGQSLNAADVTKAWYEQKNNYDFNTPKWRKDAMNFTQLVWKSTSDIGIGIAKVKGQDRCVVVAQYRPAGNGNMPGEFRKNVLPPQ